VSGAPLRVQQSLDAHLALLKHEIARLHTVIDDHIARHRCE